MDIVLTSFFNAFPDPQRGEKWEANENLIYPLAHSCERRGIKLVCLTDCFEGGQRNGVEFVKVESGINPYFQRWLSQWEYLREHTEIDRLFMVDATDVVLQFDPFWNMEKDVYYVGDEFTTLGSDWMKGNGDCSTVLDWISKNPNLLTLNCGVVGGDRIGMRGLCDDIHSLYQSAEKPPKTEMGIFNFVMRNRVEAKVIHGRGVTSIFKSYEENSGAWFKHK